MNWYKKSQTQTLILWHISNKKFKKFNPDISSLGVIWFAKDRQDLLENLHGASIGINDPIYLYKCQVIANKIAGWDEYDKYLIEQLISMGYDVVDLDNDVIVLDENKISIIDVERIK